MKIKATPVFQKNWNATSRIVVNQGGTRSSKTYSILQVLILKMLGTGGQTLSIARKTMPALKSSVMRDFFTILNELGLYDESSHNRADNTYHLHGNLIEFFSLDQPQKKRGAKRDYLFMNEANEFTFEDFTQLSLRTTKQIFLDYNPSDEFHWIYDKVVPRNDCTFIKSTYKDNPFLGIETVQEIERLREMDANLWKVFGLGERGTSEGRIFTNWQECEFFPDNWNEAVYGLDFGYNVPSALVRIYQKEDAIWVDEMLYETRLTNSDLIERLKHLVFPRTSQIYADAAEPDRIDEIHKAGFNIHPADKSVKDGILELKQRKVFVTRSSVNLWKEYRTYSYQQDKAGRWLDDPVKFNDHAIDALRYGVKTSVKRKIRMVGGRV